jgi:hypothetical protein
LTACQKVTLYLLFLLLQLLLILLFLLLTDEPQEQEEDGDNDSYISDTDSSIDEVLQIREWVIQRYLDRPLKLNQGRKFHLRVYVLAVSNLRVYVYEDMLALFALKPYDSKNLDDTLSHITNTCIQTEEADFNELQSVKLFWELEGVSLFFLFLFLGLPCSLFLLFLHHPTSFILSSFLDEVQALLDSLPIEKRRFSTGSLALQHIFSKLKGCVGECFAAVSSEMTSFQGRASSHLLILILH